MKLDYKRDLKINRNKLDEELENHAQIFMDYAVACAEAEEEMNNAEQNVKIVKAELSEKIRNNPKKYGLMGKITETAIKLCVDKSREKKVVKQKYHRAIKNYKILGSAKEAFQFQRKMGIDKLSEFLLAGILSKSGIKSKAYGVEEKESENFRDNYNKRKLTKNKRR